jgi:hypothetical protein
MWLACVFSKPEVLRLRTDEYLHEELDKFLQDTRLGRCC